MKTPFKNKKVRKVKAWAVVFVAAKKFAIHYNAHAIYPSKEIAKKVCWELNFLLGKDTYQLVPITITYEI